MHLQTDLPVLGRVGCNGPGDLSIATCCFRPMRISAAWHEGGAAHERRALRNVLGRPDMGDAEQVSQATLRRLGRMVVGGHQGVSARGIMRVGVLHVPQPS